MAKVHFAPYSAIKYVGSKAKDFNTSLARPKPTLKKGDIVIVEKKDAFNLVSKGYGEFVMVDEIEFLKADIENADALRELEDENIRLTEENAKLMVDEIEFLKADIENADALKELEDEVLRLTEENAKLMVDEIEFLKADIENADALKELEDEVLRLTEENAKLNAELLVALASLAEENTISEDTELEAELKAELEEAFGTVPEVAPETLLVNEDETK